MWSINNLRHVSIFNKKIYFCIKLSRYICNFFDKRLTTRRDLSWYDVHSHCTKACENHIILINSTIFDEICNEVISLDTIVCYSLYIAPEAIDGNTLIYLGPLQSG